MINVLSLCDGISVGKLAFNELGIETNYWAIEIDKYARMLSELNVKDIFRPCSDILDVKKSQIKKEWPKFDYVIFGAPCQSLSIAGDGTNFGGKSKLFFDCMYILTWSKERNPDVKFLIENVASMRKEPRNTMDRVIGVRHQEIDSALVSGQKRKRLYWFNWDADLPEDRGIKLEDVLDLNEGEHAYAWSKSCRKAKSVDDGTEEGTVIPSSFDERIRHDDKANVLTCSLNGTESRVMITKEDLSGFKPRKVWERKDLLMYNVDHRLLSIREVARLQTMPEWFDFSIVSKTQAQKCLGNGWTLEIIKHLLKSSL